MANISRILDKFVGGTSWIWLPFVAFFLLIKKIMESKKNKFGNSNELASIKVIAYHLAWLIDFFNKTFAIKNPDNIGVFANFLKFFILRFQRIF